MRQRDVFKMAYNRGLNRLAKDKRMTATEISCGFSTLNGEEDVQVFMKICRFNEKLLKDKPETGGLLCNTKGGMKYINR